MGNPNGLLSLAQGASSPRRADGPDMSQSPLVTTSNTYSTSIATSTCYLLKSTACVRQQGNSAAHRWRQL